MQLLFATPHRWTPYFRDVADRKVILPDVSRWDYKHQVMDSAVPSWRILAWTKGIEVALQARPKALARTWFNPDARLGHAMRWYGQMGRRVWPHEIADYFQAKRTDSGPTVRGFWNVVRPSPVAADPRVGRPKAA